MTEPPILIHYRIDVQPVLLSLRCATCGTHREVTTTMRSVQLGVAMTGWELGTTGSLDADRCPGCAERARGRAA